AVRLGVGSDSRIGKRFLYPGPGYGGSCFPKDVQALIRTAAESGQHLRILEAVEDVNHDQKEVLVGKIVGTFGDDLKGRHFALWGLAFKPNTDDMREASSRRLIEALLLRGATVTAYDPIATDEAKRVFALDLKGAPELLARLTFAASQDEALVGADALVIVTEWTAFKAPDFAYLKSVLKSPRIFDGRNLYEPDAMAELGIDYYSIGRPHAKLATDATPAV
ncbi:UDP binding domain-containing protein, partial [Paraburkholderia sp.]|uniref:UDP binding domain-containing protein n=1 Tax=Paraburkholderia sp. TaxID=1926495 RepID=UPI0025DF4265